MASGKGNKGKKKGGRKQRIRKRCMYCGQAAGTKEHVIATRFIEVLGEDERGLPVPLTLHATLSSGLTEQVAGKRITRKSGSRAYTLEYTAPVCDRCNSGWMNDIDSAAFPHLEKMIRGEPVVIDAAAQAAVAAWICKVAITARGTALDPLPIEPEWAAWLHKNHSAPPPWQVWIGRYVGARPWWYSPHDIRIELGQGSAPPPPDFTQPHGVLATLVIGYLFLQVFGVSGAGPGAMGMYQFGDLPQIWPPPGVAISWPPPYRVDDTTLEAAANRLLGSVVIP